MTLHMHGQNRIWDTGILYVYDKIISPRGSRGLDILPFFDDKIIRLLWVMNKTIFYKNNKIIFGA